MRPAVAALGACLSLLVPTGAAAQGVDVVDGQGAAGTIVEVTPTGDAPSTQVGPTQAQVTTGTESAPAASAGATIQTGATVEGDVVSDATTPTATADPQEATTETGVAQVSDETEASTDTSRTSAVTAVNVTVSAGRIEATAGTAITVRGGRSTAEARRVRKRMTSRAEARARGEDGAPGVDVGGLVTVQRVRAEAFSRAGKRVRSRREMDIRGLRVRAEKTGPVLIDVRRARMNPNGSVDARIALRTRDGHVVEGDVVLAPSHRGRDLLAAPTYAGSELAIAFAQLDRAALRRLRNEVKSVRIGGSTLDETDGTSMRVIAIQVALAGDEASGSAGRIGLGVVTVAIGDVASAAVQAGSPIVQAVGEEVIELPGTVAAGASAVPDVIGSVGAILGGESFELASRVVAVRPSVREITVEIDCEASFEGELVLVSTGAARELLARGDISCEDGARIRPTLTVVDLALFDQLDIPTGVTVVPELALESGEPFRGEELTLRGP